MSSQQRLINFPSIFTDFPIKIVSRDGGRDGKQVAYLMQPVHGRSLRRVPVPTTMNYCAANEGKRLRSLKWFPFVKKN